MSVEENRMKEALQKLRQSDRSDEKLSPETVKTNIGLGWFEVIFDKSKGASTAYDVIQKVFYRKKDGGERVGNWFFCSRCGDAWEHDASMGSAPNVRHKEKTCKELTDEQRKKYAEENKTRKAKNKLTKGRAKNAPKVASDSQLSTDATKNVPQLPKNEGSPNSQESNTPNGLTSNLQISDVANESQVSTEAATSDSQTLNAPNLPDNAAASGSTISNDANMAQLQLEVKYSHTSSELFDLIQISSEMGIVYGKIDAKKLKKSSITPEIL